MILNNMKAMINLKSKNKNILISKSLMNLYNYEYYYHSYFNISPSSVLPYYCNSLFSSFFSFL